MDQTIVALKKIYEHDMDLLILEEFISSKEFARIFLDKLQLSDDYTLHKAIHSLSDSDGESDIVLILQYPGKKVALLIEDKIDAQTMPEQSARYHKRGNSGKLRGEYDSYHIILVAPEDYHKEHLTDKNAAYEHRVSYESLRDYFVRQNAPRSAFKFSVVDFALKEKKAGYLVQEDRAGNRILALPAPILQRKLPPPQYGWPRYPQGRISRLAGVPNLSGHSQGCIQIPKRSGRSGISQIR